jgi:hypothetical protein
MRIPLVAYSVCGLLVRHQEKKNDLIAIFRLRIEEVHEDDVAIEAKKSLL